MNFQLHVHLQKLLDPLLDKKAIRLFVKREDLIHERMSGNKWRKLKYNVLEAAAKKNDTLLTFGGAYSNHIAATAAAGKQFGFHTIGLIRGEAAQTLNPTLQYAVDCGMHLRYVSREDYRDKSSKSFSEKYLLDFSDCYLIPEGGTNLLAVKGCEEILSDVEIDFDYVSCAVGTGGTLSGLINSLKPHQSALGFPSLKAADFLNDEIAKYVSNYQWTLNLDYHFGGYAKVNKALIDFINNFKTTHQISLDPVYTGKMLFGLWDLIEKDYFRRGSTIIAIHTGGLQGIEGMNQRIKNKGLQIL